MTIVGRWWLAAACALTATLLPCASATAQESGDGGLLGEIGDGWAPGHTCELLTAQDTAPTACFEHGKDVIKLSSNDIASGVAPRSLLDVSAKAFAQYPTLATPDLDAARGFSVSSEPGVSALVVLVATEHHIFNVIATSDRPFDQFAPVVIDVARRQQAHDGGPPKAAATSAPQPDDASLDPLFIDAPKGFAPIDTGSLNQTFDQLRPAARSQRVIDLLNDAPTRTRVFQAGTDGFLIVSLSEQPFDQFAAIELGGYRTATGLTDRRKVGSVDDAVGFRFEGSDGYGVVFRRGRYVATVALLAPAATAGDTATIERAIDELARRQASRLPDGATAPYFFPSTTKSVLLVIAVTTLACVLLVIGTRAVALRRRPRTDAVVRGTTAEPPLGEVRNVDTAAKALRRNGVFLLAGQIVAVDLVVLGVLALLDVLQLGRWVGAALTVGGLGGGVAWTSWRARAELKASGGAGAPARGAWRSPSSIAAALVAAATLLVGVALVARALADAAFGPSLTALERAKSLGVQPRTVSLATALIGVALLVVGAIAARLARMWARASASRLRQLDRRPPILYLRSFDDDDLPLPALLSARRPFLELFLARGSDPFEEAVTWELTPYGPVVAIGRPGRPTSSLGAARDLLPDDEWQAGVAERMADAHAIVMVLGATEGVKWELGRLAGGHLRKAILLFPPVSAADLSERWAFTAAALSETGLAVAPLPVPASEVLTAVAGERGWHVTIATRRDEATYRAALDDAMDALATAARPAEHTAGTGPP